MWYFDNPVSYLDVNEKKKHIMQLKGILPFNEVMTFYYDESGNCRKLLLNENGVNYENALTEDFILAGVAFEGTNHNTVDFSDLYHALQFQPNQKELKFKNLFVNNANFLTFANSRRASLFLKWLNESGLYIHYSTLNNLFYLLVDIVDSLFEQKNYTIFCNAIKNVLYDFAVLNRDEVLRILFYYNYPNITKCKEFCFELRSLISKNLNMFDDSGKNYLLMLCRMLKKTESLVFLQDNESHVLIKEYYLLYLGRCEVFSNSYHIFDEEVTVMEQFKKIQLVDNNKGIYNFDFIKSERNPYIQLSDLISGLFRKLFSFLDNNNLNSIVKISKHLTLEQTINFGIILGLILKSERKSPLLIENINTEKNIKDRFLKLKILAQITSPYGLTIITDK